MFCIWNINCYFLCVELNKGDINSGTLGLLKFLYGILNEIHLWLDLGIYLCICRELVLVKGVYICLES